MPKTRATANTRSSLSRDKIEAEALALIEAQGLEGFSTRKLGERLGCEAMSIYHHYPSKAHLLDALVDRTLNNLPIAPKNHSPAKRIRHLAQAWRAMSRQFPRFYLWMALHRWNSASGIKFLAEVLDCFHAAGLKPEEAARGFRVLGYYLLGATLEETSGYAQGPSAMEPMPDAQVEHLYPHVAQASRYFSQDQFDATFELGLKLLLQGLHIEE
ncbi:TetR/AcrR family transcriptional regulator [Variovorax sp. PCZ-1]|uniref:TetR/AcrR family transcriptional regulator n=1 Tax=Variovorax sp. PCZ-1 TaxID=2835533 RepID=UPI001BCD248F|nr:TetR/AcrR family transcriptional regulator [Variovorax sp. PCZ-1]MBS7806833.1 TetR/AcrR family transcriptional regulator [Variovorax sp. PCZ-1]